MKVKGRKVTTPTWVDKLLNFRHSLTEEYGQEEGERKYRALWKRINKYKRGSAEWQAEGQRIIAELEESEEGIFRTRDFDGSMANARRAAEIYQADMGGRIVRRSSTGRFSSRGGTFQVIRSKK